MKCVATIMLFIISLSSQLFSQGIPYDEEFRINTNANSYQNFLKIAPLKSGGFIITWLDFTSDFSEPRIYAQQVDANGQEIDEAFLVRTFPDGHLTEPCITTLQNAGFIICWASFGPDESNLEIFAQQFDENNQRLGNEFQVNTYTNSDQSMPVIASLSSSGFVVCWQSNQQDGSDWGIFAQQFDENGQKVGNEFQVNTYTNSDQSKPVIASLSSGGFVVCWQSDQQDGSDWGIFAQQFEDGGNRIGDEFQVSTKIEYNQFNADIAALTNGEFVICWENYGRSNDYEDIVIAQRFDKNNQRLGDEIHVKTYNLPSLSYPTITGLSNKGYTVCWWMYDEDSNRYSYAQRIDENDQRLGDVFQVNTITSYSLPVISNLTNGGFIICWNVVKQGTGSGIYGKYYFSEPINHQLTDFKLTSPKNDTQIISTNPKFLWEQASMIHECYPWEVTFDLYIDTDYNFSNPFIINGIQDTTYCIDPMDKDRTYFWKVLAHTYAGDSLWSSDIWGFYITPDATPVSDFIGHNTPITFTLHQNYPNPFNPSTTIKYKLHKSTNVILNIYNLSGQKIETLFNGYQSIGEHEIVWQPKGISSGVYFYRLQAGEHTEIKKLILQK